MSKKDDTPTEGPGQNEEALETEKVLEVLKDLPAAKRREVLLSIRSTQSYRAPLPPSSEFGQYDKVLPGAAARILDAFDQERGHRHEMDREILAINRSRGTRAQRCAFTIAIVAFAVAGFCAYVDQPWPAAVIGGSGAVLTVGSFLGARFGNRPPLDVEEANVE